MTDTNKIFQKLVQDAGISTQVEINGIPIRTGMGN